MEVANEIVAMIRLDNLEEINTVKTALEKIVKQEKKVGFKNKLLTDWECEVLEELSEALVGYSQNNPTPIQNERNGLKVL